MDYFLEGYRSLASAWTLRPGCKLLPQSPDKIAATGKIANVPLLMGDMRDEGPLFSLITAINTTTEDDVKVYFKTYWWPNASENQLTRLLELYTQDPTRGSPYGTGIANAATSQFKRIAYIVGDYSFEVCTCNIWFNSNADSMIRKGATTPALQSTQRAQMELPDRGCPSASSCRRYIPGRFDRKDGSDTCSSSRIFKCF